VLIGDYTELNDMKQKRKQQRLAVCVRLTAALVVGAAMLGAGCNRSHEASSPTGGKIAIQNTGSDTMVNLAQAWAEEYAKVDPAVSIEVSGGGSGTGIAALINGTVDIANCSRKMEPEEIAKAKQNTGKEPREFVVGYDGLAVYVHKSNPLEEITLEQLAGIYGEGGVTTQWSQLGVKLPGGASDQIVRVSRQSNSGTYQYFRESILGKGRDFKLGSVDQNGSKDVVELVSKTPGAIGYSGMGYATPEVKILHVAKKAGNPAYAPTVESTLNGTYPISRPLFMYTLGQPSGAIAKYLDWIHSDAGQKIVAQSGYVPLPKGGARIEAGKP
jgi:phosphate transport system substrate-binding protein